MRGSPTSNESPGNIIRMSQLCDEAIEAQITHLNKRLAGYRRELSGAPCRTHEQFVLRGTRDTEKTVEELQDILNGRKTER